jgi:NAD(P)-dependent dehydrogenase (short-subunit alcohol dehydrogenase family)
MSAASSEAPVAFIVGGASGIGQATSICFSQQGWRVCVGDIDASTAAQVAQGLGGLGLRVDIMDSASIEAAADAIEHHWGRGCDALVVAAAAFQPAAAPEELPMDLWDRVVDLGLKGTYLCNVAIGTRMARQGRGAIVNLASLAALHGMPLHAYGPAKAGVLKLSESLAGEWGRSGVRVNCVTPGTTLTPRIAERLSRGERYKTHPAEATALGRMVQPEDVAQAIEFLCSQRARAITGSNLLVDAGATCVAHWNMFGGPRDSRAQPSAGT